MRVGRGAEAKRPTLDSGTTGASKGESHIPNDLRPGWAPAHRCASLPPGLEELGDQMEAPQGHQDDTGQAQKVADQTREKVGEAADQAKETAQNVVSQAQNTVREQVDQRTTEAGERVGSTAEDIRSVGQELRNQGKEGPANIAEQAADRFDRAAGYLRDSDGDRILNDV